MTRLSYDHKPSLREETARVQTQGGIVIGDLMSKGYRISHPRAGQHSGAIAITRSFGDFGLSPLVSSEPFIREYVLPSHDDWSIVLASDGLFDVFTDQMLQDLHASVSQSHPNVSPQGFASLLREASYVLNSRDDISVIHLCPHNTLSYLSEAAPPIPHSATNRSLSAPSFAEAQDPVVAALSANSVLGHPASFEPSAPPATTSTSKSHRKKSHKH